MNLRNTLKSIIFYILVAFFVGCKPKLSSQENQSNYINNIDSLIRSYHNQNLFSGNILVAKNDTIVYKESFGYTNASQKATLNGRSIFNIGSIAKEFNGVSIMILVEQGKLSFDDTISKFELGLPKWSEKITIRHLLNYTGGFPMRDLELKNDKIAFNNLKRIDSLLFEPGSRFSYNNYSIFMQQRIIEKVTNKTYKEFVIENIVKPLDLKSAVFDPSPNHPNRTSCYNWKNGPCPEMEYISGWLWLDITDLYKYIQAMNSNTIISQKSFDTILINPYINYKTGSIGEYFKEMELQRHDGSSYTFRSIYLNDFKNDITIILLSNNGSNVTPKAHTIHDLMDKQYKSVFQAIKKKCLEDIELGIKAYHTLKNSNAADEYTFGIPDEWNTLGYELIKLEKKQDALKIFQLMVSEFPNSANSFDSLGEAYMINEQYDLALESYEKAIALGGTDGNAKMMLKKISNRLQNN